MEGVLPCAVELLQTLVSALAVLRQPSYKVLGGFGVLLCHHALILDRSLAILFTFLLVSALTRHWAKNGGRGENLVEMLELLAGPLLVTIGDGPVIYLLHVGEAVDNESAQKYGIAHFISLNGQTH